MVDLCEITAAVHKTQLDNISEQLKKIEKNQKENSDSINELQRKVDNGGVAIKVFFIFGAIITFILSMVKLATVLKEF